MSTIVTRKSLALGAIVALATTAFAGTPAHAAGEINLVPSAGTSYATLSTEAFVLEGSFAPGVTNANSQLWFQVKTSTNVSVDVQADSRDASDVGPGDVKPATAGTAADSADTTTFVRYVKANGTGSTDRNFLGLQLKDATSLDSADVVVTAFVDSNNDNKLTAGEWSTSKTVSFKTYASVGAVATLDEPKTADTSATGHVTLPGVNLTQVQHAVTLVFQKKSTDALDGNGGTAAKTGITALSTDAGDYKATAGNLRAFTSADAIDLIAKFNGVVVGSTVSKTATARTISKIEATVDTNDNGLATGNYGRLNSEVSVTAVVFDAVKTTDVIKDTAVKVTVTSIRTVWSTDAAEAQSVTLNGVKYTTYATLTAAAAALSLNSDASGKVNVKLVPANFVSGDTFDITFAAQNLNKVVTVTESAAALKVADADSASVRKIAKNGTATLNYTVKDQFGVAASATNLRLRVTSALAAQFVAVSGGKATVSVTPTKDSTDSLDVAVALQSSKVDTNQQTLWEATTGATNPASIRLNVSAVDDSFDTAPAVLKINNDTDLTAKQALENKAYAATDFPVVAGATLAQIRGSVITDGASVTVSGAGLAFVVKGKVYTDTVTFIAASGDAGDFDVYVAGHKPGAATVTFVTGAVTKTVTVTFAAVLVASLKNTVVAAPSAAQAGRAVTVTATLTDAYGNAIAGKTVQFALTGVGSLSSSDAVTDANGVALVRLVSSYGEDGDATVTVSHNGSDNLTDTSSTTTPNDFTLVKTVTFGITDAQVDIVEKRITAVASYTKGKTVALYVDGVKVWSKVSASDSDVVISRNLKKGTHTVTVKVSGGFVTTEKFIVK